MIEMNNWSSFIPALSPLADCGHKIVPRLTGIPTLAVLTALLAECHCFITHDTAAQAAHKCSPLPEDMP
jgi:hypothetical protein